jgi:hypothetical protein
MSQNPPEKPVKPVRKGLTAVEQREQRLAKALRANLRRRKAAGGRDGASPAGKQEDSRE